MAQHSIRFHPLIARLYDPVQTYFERCQGPAHREYLADGLDGQVLEVAVGTGAMLPYFAERTEEIDRLHGVEPDPGMWRQARDALADNSLEMELLSGRVEALPYDDDTFDYVVECGLFCSVPSMEIALAEIARVLAPDGEFRFLDHVRSDGLVGHSQDALTPVWRRIGGNCHLNRRVQPALAACDALEVTELDRPTVGHWPIREFVRGRAKPVE